MKLNVSDRYNIDFVREIRDERNLDFKRVFEDMSLSISCDPDAESVSMGLYEKY